MKLGYTTWGMPDVPVETAIRHVAELGFAGIELTVREGYSTALSRLDRAERQRIKRLLADHRLALPALAAHTTFMATDGDEHAENMSQLKAALDLAVAWEQEGHLPVVNTTPGGQPEQWPGDLAGLVERVAEATAYAASAGVILALEPHVGQMVDTPAKMIELLELVGSPYLKVNFDISHFDVLGLTIAESVAALAGHAAHTHVKDQRGRYPNHEFLIPGEGNFDFVTYLQAMQAHGYQGFITAEVSVMVQRRENYDPLAAATLSYQTLSRAFTAAGLGG
jgi:inosose dehydratase